MLLFPYMPREPQPVVGAAKFYNPYLKRYDKFLTQAGNLQRKLADSSGYMMFLFTDSPCAGKAFSGIMEEERKNDGGWAAAR
jgi:hypothetical protein